MASEDRTGSWLRYSYLGIQFCLMFGLFVLAGTWGDSELGWTPWLTFAGTLLGMAAATYSLVRATSAPK